MTRLISQIAFPLSISILLMSGIVRGAEGKNEEARPTHRVLVLAGGHGYEQKPFRKVFESYPDLKCTFLDEKKGGEAFDDISNWPYDAVVLFNYKKELSEKQRENFLKLMDRGVGLVVLHHGIYAYLSWPEFKKIVGFTQRLNGYKHDVDFTVHIEDANHPITRGVSDFQIQDETYKGYQVDPNVQLLLTTSESTNAKTIAWTHTYRQSPVCYLQLGHGPAAFRNKNFITLLGNAIRWSIEKPKKTD